MCDLSMESHLTRGESCRVQFLYLHIKWMNDLFAKDRHDTESNWLRRMWQQCLYLGLVVCALVWSYIECFILNFIPRVASCFYITELSTCGRNDVAIWIFLLDIYCHSNTVDRSSDAHDILTWSAVTVTCQRGAVEPLPASKDHWARPVGLVSTPVVHNRPRAVWRHRPDAQLRAGKSRSSSVTVHCL